MHRKYANPAGLDANHIVAGYVKRAWSGRDALVVMIRRNGWGLTCDCPIPHTGTRASVPGT
jgi:hypothetical protein